MNDVFVLDGNLLCLDLVNTQLLRQGEPVDLLTDFTRLVEWLESAGVLDARAARETLGRWRATREAEQAFQAALDLRRVTRSIADRLMAGKSIGSAMLDRLNIILAARPTVTTVRRTKGGYQRVAHSTATGPLPLLGPVAESTVALLTDLDPQRLGKCEGEKCVLYFFDSTKNHSRRWCSMERCGNRAKAATHYRRQREGLT